MAKRYVRGKRGPRREGKEKTEERKGRNRRGGRKTGRIIKVEFHHLLDIG
jgi:hypothetical protein